MTKEHESVLDRPQKLARQNRKIGLTGLVALLMVGTFGGASAVCPTARAQAVDTIDPAMNTGANARRRGDDSGNCHKVGLRECILGLLAATKMAKGRSGAFGT